MRQIVYLSSDRQWNERTSAPNFFATKFPQPPPPPPPSYDQHQQSPRPYSQQEQYVDNIPAPLTALLVVTTVYIYTGSKTKTTTTKPVSRIDDGSTVVLEETFKRCADLQNRADFISLVELELWGSPVFEGKDTTPAFIVIDCAGSLVWCQVDISSVLSFQSNSSEDWAKVVERELNAILSGGARVEKFGYQLKELDQSTAALLSRLEPGFMNWLQDGANKVKSKKDKEQQQKRSVIGGHEKRPRHNEPSTTSTINNENGVSAKNGSNVGHVKSKSNGKSHANVDNANVINGGNNKGEKKERNGTKQEKKTAVNSGGGQNESTNLSKPEKRTSGEQLETVPLHDMEVSTTEEQSISGENGGSENGSDTTVTINSKAATTETGKPGQHYGSNGQRDNAEWEYAGDTQWGSNSGNGKAINDRQSDNSDVNIVDDYVYDESNDVFEEGTDFIDSAYDYLHDDDMVGDYSNFSNASIDTLPPTPPLFQNGADQGSNSPLLTRTKRQIKDKRQMMVNGKQRLLANANLINNVEEMNEGLFKVKQIIVGNGYQMPSAWLSDVTTSTFDYWVMKKLRQTLRRHDKMLMSDASIVVADMILDHGPLVGDAARIETLAFEASYETPSLIGVRRFAIKNPDPNLVTRMYLSENLAAELGFVTVASNVPANQIDWLDSSNIQYGFSSDTRRIYATVPHQLDLRRRVQVQCDSVESTCAVFQSEEAPLLSVFTWKPALHTPDSGTNAWLNSRRTYVYEPQVPHFVQLKQTPTSGCEKGLKLALYNHWGRPFRVNGLVFAKCALTGSDSNGTVDADWI